MYYLLVAWMVIIEFELEINQTEQIWEFTSLPAVCDCFDNTGVVDVVFVDAVVSDEQMD